MLSEAWFSIVHIFKVLLNKGKVKIESTHPKARAPDHCNRKPSRADMRTAVELFRSHLNNSTPGGSNHGIKATKKKIVIGVVFHINLHSEIVFFNRPHYLSDIGKRCQLLMTYASAVQLACCCKLDQRILFIALGIIHAMAIHAPKTLNSRSVIVATATPAETTARAKTCKMMDFIVTS